MSEFFGDTPAPLRNIGQGQQFDADGIAKARQISRVDQQPLSMSDAANLARQQNIDLAKARGHLDGAPRTSQFFSDPQNAAIAHDDTESLSWWEKGWGDFVNVFGRRGATAMAPGGMADIWNRGQADVDAANDITNVLVLGQGSEADRQRVERLMAGRADSQQDEAGPFSLAIRQLPQLAEGVRGSSDEMAAGALAGGLVGTAVPVIGTGVGLVGGTAAGFLAGQAKTSFMQNAGQAYEAMRAIRSEDGKLIDPTVARWAAIGVGAISGGLDVLGIEKLGELAAAPFISKKAIVSGLLQRPTLQQALLRISRKYAGAVGMEGVTEGAQEVVQAIGEEIAKGASDGTFKHQSIGDVASRAGNAAVQGATVAAVLGAPLAGGGLAIENGRARRAEQSVAAFDAIAANASTSKLKVRDADAYETAVNNNVRGAPGDTVFIDAEKFHEFFQSKQADAYEAAARLGIDRPTLDRALSEGGDIAIPTGTYAAKMAGGEADTALRPHMKFDPDGMTSAQSEQFKRDYPELVRTMRAGADQAVAEDKPRSEASQAMRAEITAKLKAAGFSDEQIQPNLEILAGGYETLADRTGTPLPEFTKRFPLPQIVSGARGAAAPVDVAAAIQSASTNNASAGYMTTVARKESGFKVTAAQAQAGQTAAGLYGFTKGTFLGVTKAHAEELGVAGLSEGQILAKRGDPAFSSRVMALHTADNRAGLARRLGREPSDGDLYVAHFLGEAGGAELIRTAESQPGAIAAEVFPKEAKVNKTLFYAKDGRPFTAAELYANTVKDFDGAGRIELAGKADLAPLDGSTGLELTADEAQTGATDPARELNQTEVARATAEGIPIAQGPEAVRAFEDWFGDSHAATASGAPITLFHGTDRDFEAFDKRQRGSATRDPDARGAFFLSDDPDVASGYADVNGPDERGQNVVPAVVSLQNPQVRDMGGRDYDPAEFADIVNEAKDAGHDGVIFRNTRDGTMRGDKPSTTYAVFEPEQIKSVHNRGTFDPTDPRILHQAVADFTIEPGEAPRSFAGRVVGAVGQLFQKHDPIQKRGSIILPPNGLGGGRQAIINLFEARDLSTLLHETGHLYLEMLQAIGSAEGAPQGIVDDLKTVRDWLGLKDGEAFDVSHHEKFAEGFEQYLYEGKAPSTALKSVFETIAGWMAFVYRRMRGVRTDLAPEVREVLDRILASDDAIREARESQSLSPLFASADEAGMTEATWARYEHMRQRAADEGAEKARTRVMSAVQRQAEAWWRDQRAEVRDEVRKEVEARPIERAYDWLARGKWLNGEAPTGLEPIKLNFAAVKAEYGGMKGLPVGVATKDGAHPDVVAGLFGFGSGDELIKGLRERPKRAAEIDSITDTKMIERHGDPLKDGTIAAVAMKAAHNDAQARQMEIELEALQGRPVSKGFAEIARREVAQRRVSELLSPAKHLTAERRAAKAAFEAMRTGDRDEAARQKYRQLVAYHLWNATRQAAEEIERIQTYARKFDRDGVRKNIAPDHLEQIDALLEDYDFRDRSGPELARQESLFAFHNRMVADGREAELDIDRRLIEQARKENYSRLTLDELRGLRDTVKNLEAMGRFKKDLLKAQADRDFAEVVGELVASADHSGLKVKPPLASDPNMRNDRLIKVGEFFDRLDRPEYILRALDGFKDGGAWTRELAGRFYDAANDRLDLMENIATKFDDAVREHGGLAGKLFGKATFVAEVGESFSHAGMLSIVLNLGNEENRAALLEGQGWTESQLQAVLANTIKADWDLAQRIWDLLENELRGPAFDLHERTTGVRPQAVEAQTITTEHGAYRGGYYPLKYDGARNVDAAKFEADQAVTEAFAVGQSRAMTRRGHLEARVGSGGRPVKLSLDVLFEHVANVVQDIAFREAVIDVNRLIHADPVKAAVVARYGVNQFRQFQQWVSDNARSNNAPLFGYERLIRHMRLAAPAVNLGFNIASALQQPAGIINVLPRVGWRAIPALAKYAPLLLYDKTIGHVRSMLGDDGGYTRRIQFVMDSSPFMRERIMTVDRDARAVLEKASHGGKVRQFTSQAMFYLTSLLDQVVSVPTWLASYDMAMEGKIENIEAGDHKAATRHAENVVGMTVGRSDAVGLAPIMRGSELEKLATVHFQFLNLLWNQIGEQVAGARSGNIAPAIAVANLALLLVVSPILSSMFAGRWGKEDDESDEAARKRQIATVALYPFATAPVAREISSYFANPQYGFQASPTLSGLASYALLPADLWKDAHTGSISRNTKRDAIMAAGFTWKLPARAVWRVTDETDQWLQGGDFNPAQAAGLERQDRR